jgi:serine/threonine protein kinase
MPHFDCYSLLRKSYNVRNHIFEEMVRLHDQGHQCLKKYKLLDIVDSGTFGQVFIAIDINVRPLSLYAIKAYKPHIKKEYGQHEIRQLKKIGTSPYIAELLAASTTPGGTVLVMPFYSHEPFEVRNAINFSMLLDMTWQHRSTSRVYHL